MKFIEKFQKISEKNNSLLCVGLDTDLEKIPQHIVKSSDSPLLSFNQGIIKATADIVCAYKLNMAFYEQYGIEGINVLLDTIKIIPNDIIVIIDGKRNDIGNTAARYANSLFNVFNADAVTVTPYLGYDGIQPFLDYTDRQSFILCRTSNKSAGDFQDLIAQNMKLYEHVAKKIVEWNVDNNCGAVVGATYPQELKNIRRILGNSVPLLIPGIGKQGGNVNKTIEYGTNENGTMAIINSSRGIIYKDSTKNYDQSARHEAENLRKEINKSRNLKTKS
jgi:orotidine-5'-phosphate decarboxylase